MSNNNYMLSVLKYTQTNIELQSLRVCELITNLNDMLGVLTSEHCILQETIQKLQDHLPLDVKPLKPNTEKEKAVEPICKKRLKLFFCTKNKNKNYLKFMM